MENPPNQPDQLGAPTAASPLVDNRTTDLKNEDEIKHKGPGRLPSLKDGRYPGWDVKVVAGQVFMQEHGTGRKYQIPSGRFNKAAQFLQQRHVLSGLEASLQQQDGKPLRNVCRCRRRCPSLFDVDYLLATRHWFFEHPTHDEAVSELAKIMALNYKQFHSLYVLRGGIQVLPVLYKLKP